MIFNTIVYFFGFLLPAAILFRTVPHKVKPYILGMSGAAFFIYFSVISNLGGWWGAACLLLILYQSWCCLYILRPGDRRRGIFVIVQSVIILCLFKYLNFFGGLVLGKPDGYKIWQNSFLPLGISFFTFEFVHYAAESIYGRVGKGTEQNERGVGQPSLGEFLAFILFFPTMVAGPIKRIQDFLPKLQNPSTDWATDFNRGMTRILCGLAKKFAFADLLSAFTDHLTREGIESASGRIYLLIWIVAYTFKIYFDFAAYSDIAIGSARLFGIKVPENFNAPYIARNIGEFWSRWHISLSKFLFEYIYIPLGGSRAGEGKTYRNLIIVMLVSGLWHGAGTGFILWGLCHGIMLAVHRWWIKSYLKIDPKTEPPSRWYVSLASWFLTFTAVTLTRAFFVMDVPTALLFFRRLIFG
jgi:alginate O-acetyltransferase complex protein AlgI